MFTISKDFAFSASHVLEGLAAGHQCGRLHGHNYTVRVTIASHVLDEHGFVIDYGDLAPFDRWVKETLDHRHLNDVAGLVGNPTAENLARYCYEHFRGHVVVPADATVAVGVSETPKTWAWWTP